MAKKKPQPPTVLQGTLIVKELSAESSPACGVKFGSWPLDDGSRIEVWMNLGTKSAMLTRTGHPTRLVELASLVNAMMTAGR